MWFSKKQKFTGRTVHRHENMSETGTSYSFKSESSDHSLPQFRNLEQKSLNYTISFVSGMSLGGDTFTRRKKPGDSHDFIHDSLESVISPSGGDIVSVISEISVPKLLHKNVI